MTFELDAIRAMMPAAGRFCYLNHAAITPLLHPVRRRIDALHDLIQDRPDQRPFDDAACRAVVARLIGAEPTDIALVPNTGTGLAQVALGLHWRPGDNVVLPAGQFPTNVYPWLGLRRSGVEPRVVKSKAGGWTLADIEAASDGRTRVVAVSSVEYLDGYRGPLADVGEWCRERGILLVVDAIQHAGMLPLDVRTCPVDVVAAGGYKWLMGPGGTGFLYVRPEVLARLSPPIPGPHATVGGVDDVNGDFELWPDARRLEGGNLSWAAFHGWVAALELLLSVGMDQVAARVDALAWRLHQGLRTLGVQLLSPEDDRTRSGIVSFACGDAGTHEALAARLRAEGIIIALRAGGTVMRASPHFYNTEAEIDFFLDTLRVQMES